MLSAERIVVRAPNWVGDVVMATPGFRALRAGFPGARITLHLRPGLEPLVAGAPWFDELLPVVSYRSGRPRLSAWARDVRALRARRFDLGLCLPDSFAAAWLMHLGGVRHRVGYATPGRSRLLDLRVAPFPLHRGRRMVPRERHVLGLAEAVGCAAQGTHLELFVTPEEDARARRLLEARSVASGRPRVMLAPGAAYGSAKQWPAESYAALGDALDERGAEVVLIGSPSERGLTAAVRSRMRRPALDLAPELDLGVVKALLRRAQLLVCNDAGTRHIAVALGTPCVVLFGPTSLAKTAWNLERVTVLASNVACRPCYHRDCPVDHRCMGRVPPRRVLDAALAALGETAGPGAVQRGEA